MPNFTNCKQINKTYNGANGKKISIIYNNEKYMLKFPPKISNNTTSLSYSNGCINEYLGCHIFESIGIDTQKTILGTYNINNKEKIVCACKDFATNGYEFADFININNSILTSEENGRDTEIKSVMNCIQKQKFINPQKLSDYYWNMFVVDALLGNFDRHNGNWGILTNQQTGQSKIAPVFDCGSTLLPQADENIIKNVLNNEAEMNNRIFTFPTSALKINGQKLKYYDYMVTTNYQPCINAITRIVPKINLNTIHKIIDDTPYINKLQKEFYSTYIDKRYEKIIQPAYQRVYQMQQSKNRGALAEEKLQDTINKKQTSKEETKSSPADN